MRKILYTLLLIIVLTFTGCHSELYPYIEYRNSSYNFDSKNKKIEVLDGYVLNQGNSYEWIETESGFDLVIHFVKGGE